MARGEQDVPGERIDRRSADDTDPLKMLVGRRDDLEIDADDENDGRLEHRLGQPGWRGRSLDRRGIHRRWIDRVPRIVAGRRLGGVPLGGGRGQRGQRFTGGALAHHDHTPALTVPSTRREARPVENVEQHGIGQRIVGELARCERRAHDVVQLHDRLPGAGSPANNRWAIITGMLRTAVTPSRRSER